jgi:hypothetical protein
VREKVSIIHKQISELESQLGPVVCPVPPTNGPKLATPVTSALAELHDDLNSVIDRLADLMGRIEL